MFAYYENVCLKLYSFHNYNFLVHFTELYFWLQNSICQLAFASEDNVKSILFVSYVKVKNKNANCKWVCLNKKKHFCVNFVFLIYTIVYKVNILVTCCETNRDSLPKFVSWELNFSQNQRELSLKMLKSFPKF